MTKLKLNLKCLFFLPYIFFTHMKYAVILFNFSLKCSLHDVNRGAIGDIKADRELGKVPNASYLEMGESFPKWYKACTSGVHNLITKRFENYISSFRG